MLRRSSVLALMLVIGMAIPASALQVAPPAEVRAVHDGRSIPLSDVHLYHCHDGAFPEIRCFDTQEERDADSPGAGTIAPKVSTAARRPATESVLTLFYVTFYEHQSYGGASFTASQTMSDLSSFGWNDIISSFQSLNGQRPKWWQDVSFGTPSWQWAAGASVSYVGGAANDRFSSVKNVP